MRENSFLCLLMLLFLAGCGGESNKNDVTTGNLPKFTLTVPAITVTGDMLKQVTVMQQIGTVTASNASAQTLYFHLDLRHNTINSADVLIENGRVYARVFLKAAFSMVDLNAPTRLEIPTKITACLNISCTQQLPGSPANLNVTLVFAPAEIINVPQFLSFSSDEADNNEGVQTLTSFSIHNTSTEPLYSTLTHYSEQLFQHASLSRATGSVSDYELKLQFLKPETLANKQHFGLVSMQFCYDSSCNYRVKNSQQQVAITYNQLGSAYKDYPDLNVLPSILPPDITMQNQNHFLSQENVLVGYIVREQQTFLVAYDLSSGRLNELDISGDAYNMHSGASHLMFAEWHSTAQGMMFEHKVYGWNNNNFTLINSFTLPNLWNNVTFYNNSIYTYNHDASLPYRYNIGPPGALVNSVFPLSSTHIVDNSNGRFYNIGTSSPGWIQQWQLTDAEPHLLSDKAISTAGSSCWEIFKLLNGYGIINNCAEVYTFNTGPNDEIKQTQLLSIPETHEIKGIAVNDVKQQFVLILHPKSNNSCNKIKSYCDLIVQRYKNDLTLMDEYGWRGQGSAEVNKVEYPSEYVFYDQSGETLYMFKNDSPKSTELFPINFP
ncbi:hypothetical protein [Rheinheimera sp. WS51]|uniref:hypothetical protein n=1 Tax=Rheinheimera sp. WS51 TaxID=3425886 RepID=UPI003D93DB13